MWSLNIATARWSLWATSETVALLLAYLKQLYTCISCISYSRTLDYSILTGSITKEAPLDGQVMGSELRALLVSMCDDAFGAALAVACKYTHSRHSGKTRMNAKSRVPFESRSSSEKDTPLRISCAKGLCFLWPE